MTRDQSGAARMLAAILCALCSLLWVPAAVAHAALIASDPPENAVRESAPHEIRLTFDEPVAPLVFKIVQPDGRVIDLPRVDTDQGTLVATLPPLAQQGTYALSWRVVSADGHPVGGSRLFSIGTASAADATPHAAPVRDTLIWLARLAWFAGLLGGVGLVAFQALHATRRAAHPDGGHARPGVAGLGALGASGILGALASLGLLGVDALDAPLSGLFTRSAWRTALATSFTGAVLFTGVALGLAALGAYVSAVRLRKWLALAALAALGLALASSGHASTAPPAWIARPAVWLHAVAATAWIGALLPLAHALRKDPDLDALRRFSRTIPSVLLVLIGSGAVIVYLQFDQPQSLWLTAYGQILGAKLLLVAALLALGAYNRFRLTARVLAGEAPARRAMRRSIGTECVLALAVLAVVSLWRFTPPPRALAAAQATAPRPSHPVSLHIQADDTMAMVTLTPPDAAHAGALTLTLSKADATALRAQAVQVVFSNTAAGLEPIRYTARQAPDGTWHAAPIHLPGLTHWQLEIDALVSDFDRIRMQAPLVLEPPGAPAPPAPHASHAPRPPR